MKAIAISDILQVLQPIEYIGKDNITIQDLIATSDNNKRDNVLMWLNDKNLHRIKNIQHGTIICGKFDKSHINQDCNYIVVENPRGAFRHVLESFFALKETPKISSSAKIHDTVKLGAQVSIGEYVVIEEGCVLGNHIKIGHGTVLKAGTIIDDESSVGNNCTIGDKGLGYEKDENDNWQHIPHIGNVWIKSQVSIHDNVVINRAVLGSTIIGKHSKIDSFTMVAHGVQIGENTMICGHAAIAGSTIIGNHCWIAPNATILNKLKIGNNVFVGIGTVVIRNVADGKKLFGNPAKELNT